MSKILLSIGSLNGGGAERVVSVWSKQLVDIGNEVGILIYGRNENEYSIDERVSIFTIVPEYKDYAKLPYYQRVLKARRIIKQFSPDVVMSFLQRNQITTMFASCLLKVHRVETVRISPWEAYNKKSIESFLWKLCFRTCHAAIVQTKEQAKFFSKSIQKKIYVVSNPLGEQYIQNYKTGYSKTIRQFIAAGRICEQKNYPMLIRSFSAAHKINPLISLRIFGEGNSEYVQYIKGLINDLKMEKSIQLCGKSLAIDTEYQKSDAYIMSSNFEGMPNSLAEAMASGLICISTDCRTGPKDLIDNGINGILIPTGDEKALTDAIIMVCQMNITEASEMGKRAREKALFICGNDFSLNRLIDIL